MAVQMMNGDLSMWAPLSYAIGCQFLKELVEAMGRWDKDLTVPLGEGCV